MIVTTPVLVSIDPGLRHAGVAVFVDGLLVGCELVRVRKAVADTDDPVALNAHVAGYVTRFVRELARSTTPTTVVAEWPRVFGRGRSKGDPNDLLPLSGCSSACVARLQPEASHAVRPDEWKGTMPTDGVLEGRVLARLAEVESLPYRQACHRAGALSHNITDAVGIGLWALARLDPARVIPR